MTRPAWTSESEHRGTFVVWLDGDGQAHLRVDSGVGGVTPDVAILNLVAATERACARLREALPAEIVERVQANRTDEELPPVQRFLLAGGDLDALIASALAEEP